MEHPGKVVFISVLLPPATISSLFKTGRKGSWQRQGQGSEGGGIKLLPLPEAEEEAGRPYLAFGWVQNKEPVGQNYVVASVMYT